MKNWLESYLNSKEDVQLPLKNFRRAFRAFWDSLKNPFPGWKPQKLQIPLNLAQKAPLKVGFYFGMQRWGESLEMPEILPTPLEKPLILYPRTETDGLSFRDTSQHAPSWNELLQLKEASAEAPQLTPDLVFVPALLVDRQGHRIGRGGGYYDRYLNKHPQALAVALIHSCFVVDEIPVHWLQSHDKKVDAFITENEVYWIKNQGEKLLCS